MPRPPVQTHYLRANDSVWSPPAVLYWDTEATPIPGRVPETLELKLWSAMLVDRRPTKARKVERRRAHGQSPADLVAFIDRCFVGRETIWAYAHNLSFDLVTTRLPMALIEAGWSITDAAVSGRSPWLRFQRGRRRLTLVDSGSWLPVPLGDLGAAVGVVKPELPDSDDTDAAWLVRCDADVDILAAAMGGLMDWWDRNALGRWSLTGSATGWHAFRHVPSVWRVVVDPEPDAVAADRRAVHGGRRGVWRVGDLAIGPLLELDFTAAYPTVARHLPLPLRRSHHVDGLPVDHPNIGSARWGFAGRVKIATDTPRYPCRVGGGTFYPVGEFWTDLAGPEVNEAARCGDLVAIGPGYVHELGHALSDWAAWCIDTQNGEHPDSPPVARIAAKHWGRAIIGKWASRSFDRVELGPAPSLDWGYEEGWDHDGGVAGGMVDIGGRRWWVAATSEPDNAYPAVLAWVESYVRVRLNRFLESVPAAALVQCDTDGLIVAADYLTADQRARLSHSHLDGPGLGGSDGAVFGVRDGCGPLALRVKRAFTSARVLGPQHYEAGGVRRFSGLPRDAVELGGNRYEAKLWPKLQWQMSNGSADGYVRPTRSALITGPYAAGWVTQSGRVIPPQVTIGPGGENQLVPYGLSRSSGPRPALAPRQNPILAKLP